MDFQIKDTKKSLNIKNEDGEILKTFTLDVGNYDQLKKWSSALSELTSVAKEDMESNIELVVQQFESVIPAILGAGSWSFLWDAFGQNLIIAAGFTNKLLKFVNDCMNEARKEYV